MIVSSFASHVHRIQQVLDAAHAHGRKVAFVGRSMVRNMGIARELGYLTVPKGLVVDLKDLDRLPANQIALVCTAPRASRSPRSPEWPTATTRSASPTANRAHGQLP